MGRGRTVVLKHRRKCSHVAKHVFAGREYIVCNELRVCYRRTLEEE
jgi:hypothetical protein